VSTHSYQCTAQRSQQKTHLLQRDLTCQFLLLYHYQSWQQKKREKKITVNLWKRVLRERNYWKHIAELNRRTKASSLKQLAEDAG